MGSFGAFAVAVATILVHTAFCCALDAFGFAVLAGGAAEAVRADPLAQSWWYLASVLGRQSMACLRGGS
jgi:hypothetical protein